jgi:predicted cobalt transporter CbtA
MDLTYAVLLRRALIAGLVAGAVVAVFLVIVVEPTIGDAIALEEAAAALEPVSDAGAGHTHAEPLFTRTAQTIGGAGALIIFSITLAVIFATVYASIRHRIRATSELTRVLKVAAIGFSCIALFPWLAYPANPPAVGDPDTVNERTIQYLAALAFAVLAAVLIGRLSSWLRARTDDANRIVLVAAAIVVVYGGGLLALPATPDAIDPIVPADLIWQFRLRSIGTLALVWATFGLAFGWLLQRACDQPSTVPASGATAPA